MKPYKCLLTCCIRGVTQNIRVVFNESSKEMCPAGDARTSSWAGPKWNSLIYLPTLSLLTEKAMAPHPVLLPGKSHGRRSLVGCSTCSRKESDTTEHTFFLSKEMCPAGDARTSSWAGAKWNSLIYLPTLSLLTGEGDGTPLQYSCLENPMDGGAR